jgi:thioesterase domain-containing protein
MARRLQAHGERIEPLILLDTTVDERCWPTTAWLRKMSAIGRKRLLELNTLPPRQILRYVVERLHGSSRHLQFRFGTLPRSVLENSSRIRREFDIPRSLLRVHASALDAMTAYRPAKYSGEVTLMRCAERSPRTYDAAPLWASICQKLAIYQVPGNHETMIKDPAVEILADTISRCL